MADPSYTELYEVILGEDEHGPVFLPMQMEPQLGVSVSLLGIYPPKQVIGDFTRDLHQLLSAFIQSSWIGGGQIFDVQEATDTERYWFANAETRYPRTLVLPPLTYKITGPNTNGSQFISDFNGKTYCSYGDKLREVQTLAAANGITLTAAPVGTGIVFRGTGAADKLFIPLGAAGLDDWDGTTLTNTAARTAIALCLFDQKLYTLETDGSVWQTVNGTVWTDTTIDVDGSLTPRDIHTFYDRADNPAMHAITDESVFALAPEAPAVYATRLKYPRHPDQGLASDVWNADLYVSVGLGIHRYTGQVITAMGPDRDDGLPQEFQGRVQAMVGEYNGLIILLKGVITGTEVSEELELDLGMGGEDFYVFTNTASSTVLTYNSFGWHTLWISDEPGSSPTTIGIGNADGTTYRLYWGYGGHIYAQDLPLRYENPKQVAARNYAASGYLETGWMDMNMTGSRKTVMSVEIDTVQCTATENVNVSYATDYDEGWTLLGSITTNGHHQFRFGGHGTHPDGSVGYHGIGFERMRLRFDLVRGSTTTLTPVIQSFTIAFQKRMGKLKAWEFVVDLSDERFGTSGQYKGRGQDQIRRFLEEAIDDEEMMSFCHQGNWHDVTLAGVSGLDATGQSLAGNRRINVVESFEL